MSKNSNVGYGTLPTSTAPTTASASTDLPIPLPTTPNTLIARARFHTENFIARHRLWREFFNHSAVTRPLSYDDARRRIKRNLNYFRVNYAKVILLILFLSQLYQPISMITFLVVFIGWFFLYFFRDPHSPVVIIRIVLGTKEFVTVLTSVTGACLEFTSMWSGRRCLRCGPRVYNGSSRSEI
ncbi:hypothetical protein L2E82_34318 [Cichorium intybus]|uniref:Uncharacterized protein n=1 Tax=Cichorium intybus TaxID=13427 RepID=A0ACB9BLY6_CICIN|nr:hypothetical protein L2E82_34318 [Cichorium intybus]